MNKVTGVFVAPGLLSEVEDKLGKYKDAAIIANAESASFFRQAILRKTFDIVIFTPVDEKAFVVEQIAVRAKPRVEKHEITQQKTE